MSGDPAVAGLPAAEVQNPSCGACGLETSHDGYVFGCEGCDLVFATDDLSATFRDPEASPCGAACDNSWHGENRINRGFGYECVSCPLPADHSTMHHHPCRPVLLAAGARR